MPNSPKKKPAKPVALKREALLDTAWTLFCRNGFHAIGIDTILAEAGVAKMTLYHHFYSKEDLIAAALNKKGTEILAGVEQFIAAAGADPEKRVLAVFDWLEAWMHSDQFSGCAFLKASGEYPIVTDMPHMAASDYKQALQNRLEALCNEAGYKSPKALARQFMVIIDGATVQADLHKNSAYAADARAMARALLKNQD